MHQMILKNRKQDIIVQRKNVFQFIIADATLKHCHVTDGPLENSRAVQLFHRFKHVDDDLIDGSKF